MSQVPHLSRADRRRESAISRKLAQARPAELTKLPRHEWPPVVEEGRARRIAVWISRQYLVQAFEEKPVHLGTPPIDPRFPEPALQILRLSVCRVTLNPAGRFDDGLSWDELQAIKRRTGYARHYAIEIYPCDVDVVNVANMRHLWLLSRPLPIGWFSHGEPPP